MPHLYEYSATFTKPTYLDTSIKKIITLASLTGTTIYSSLACSTLLSSENTGSSMNAMTLAGNGYSYVIIYTVSYTNDYTDWKLIFHLDDTGYSYFSDWQNYADNNNQKIFFRVTFCMR